MKNDLYKSLLPDIALFGLVLFLYYYGLGNYGLLNNNEGLYAEIPREMLQNGQCIIPHLNGLPYIEKPPLLYWLTAFIYNIGGISEFTARFIPATAGAFLSFATYFFARQVSSFTTARLSLLVISTTGGLLVFSRMVFFDVLLTLFLSLSFFSFFIWYQTKKKTAIRVFYFSLALAALTKGFVALVLCGLFILLFLLITKSFKKTLVLQFLDFWGIFLFILTLAPWHIAASLNQKEFAYFYFINEHFLRFIGERIPKDYYSGPWYYYLPRLFISLLPWSLALPLLLKKSLDQKTLIVFLWTWVFVFLLFFSVSQAKANYYLVTIFPPISLLIALKLEAFSEIPYLKKIRTGIAVFFSVVLPLSGFSILHWNLFLPEKAHLFTQQVPSFFFLIWLGWSVFLLACIKYFKNCRFWPETLIAVQIIPLLLIGLLMVSKIDYLFSERAIMQTSPCKELPLFLYKDFEKVSSVRFYYQKNIPIIDSISSDLYFGLHTQEGLSMNATPAQFQTDSCIAVFSEEKTNFKNIYPKAREIIQKGKVTFYLLKSLNFNPIDHKQIK